MSILADLGLAVAGIVLIYAGIHMASRRARRRDASRRRLRRPRISASLGRAPFVWVSFPLRGGWRIGRRFRL